VIDTVQVVECLTSKLKDLVPSPVPSKKKVNEETKPKQTTKINNNNNNKKLREKHGLFLQRLQKRLTLPTP
jgi:hypothetical protein